MGTERADLLLFAYSIRFLFFYQNQPKSFSDTRATASEINAASVRRREPKLLSPLCQTDPWPAGTPPSSPVSVLLPFSVEEGTKRSNACCELRIGGLAVSSFFAVAGSCFSSQRFVSKVNGASVRRTG